MKIQPPSDYRPDRASLLRKALLAATAALGASACNASAEEPVRIHGTVPTAARRELLQDSVPIAENREYNQKGSAPGSINPGFLFSASI